MAQIVKLRRSSVSGQKPTNSNLQLGELALNTTDGKVFMAKSGSLGPSVEELITTNTVNTGSINLSGSIGLIGDEVITGSLIISGSGHFIGNQTVTGSLYTSGSNELVGNTILSGTLKIEGQYPASVGSQSVSIKGNVDMNGYLRLDPVVSSIDTSISGAYMFVTASTGDLYFSQNIKGYNNTTRLRWLEGNLYSGLLNGGIISATNGGTTFNVASGSGIIVNLNASLTDDPYPIIKNVKWDTFTGQTLTDLTSSIQTFVGIDGNGQILQQPTAFNDGQYNTVITLGTVIHQDKSTVNASITYPNMAYGYKQRTYDFFKAFGPLKLSGLDIITANTLGLNVGSGTAWADGRNYSIDPNNPSYITDSGTAVSKIFRYYHVSGSTFVQDTNNASGYTSLDVTHYVNNGVLTTVPGNNVNNYEWTNQRIFWYPNSATKGIVVYYGNKTYASVTEAAANVQFEPFIEIENTKQNAVYLGSIAVRKDADWANSSTFLVLPSGIFRNVGGSGGGGAIPSARFTDLLDVDVAGANNGDLVSYNDTTLKWEHGKQLSGSYQITGSLNITNGVTGSFTGSFKGDGSGLTNLSNITGSIGQVAVLDSSKSVSGSTFTYVTDTTLGLGTPDYNIVQPERLMVDNDTSWNIATFQTTQNDSYAEVNIKNLGSGSNSSADLVIWNDVTTENNNFLDLGMNSSNYSTGYLGYGNDAYLITTGNDLYVGSLTTGSNGHLHLFGGNHWMSSSISIYTDATIGINTDKFDNQASTIPSSAEGFAVEISGSVKFRNDITVLGTITAEEIHTSYVTSSVLYKSGSTKFGNSSDDTHQFTGSLHMSDETTDFSIVGNGFGQTSLISPNGALVLTPGIYGVQINGLFPDLKVNGNINTDGYISSSTNFRGDGSGLFNLPYSGLTGVPTLVSGSSQISYSGLTGIPSGIISGSSQVIDLGFTTTSSFNTFTSSYVNDSSSFDGRINDINSATSSYVLNSETSSMTVLSSSYAVTASYALSVLGGSGSEGRTAKMEQTIASTTWTFYHYLGERFPAIDVFNSGGFAIIPSSIEAIDDNHLVVTFSSPQTGYVSATVGGGIPGISGSYDGRVLAVSGSSAVWKENIVSGSLQISNLGFPTTGSNTFVGNQIISGSLTIANTKIGSLCTTSTGNTVVLDLGTFDGATIDYVVKYGSNRRFGTIMGVWDGAQYEYNEATTMDIGNTNDISFNIDATGKLHAVSTSNTWEVTLLYRALGC